MPASRSWIRGRRTSEHMQRIGLTLLALAAGAALAAPLVAPHPMEHRFQGLLNAPPTLPHLRADDGVPELARQAGRQLVTRVDREREDIGRLVHAEVLGLQLAHLLRPNERHAELSRVYAFAREHVVHELAHGHFVHVDAAAVSDLDLDHGRRRAPRRADGTPRRFAGQSCAGRHPRGRSG